MARIDNWLAVVSTRLGPPDDAHRATLAWNRIQDKPSTIVFLDEEGNALDAQTVRVEYSEALIAEQNPSGMTTRRQVVVYGVKGHPTQGTANVKAGYSFKLNDTLFNVRDVVATTGELQARCVAVS